MERIGVEATVEGYSQYISNLKGMEAATQGATGSIQKSASAAQESTGHLSGLGSALGKVGAIAAGFVVAQGILQLPGLLSGAANAAIEDEAATMRLDQALRNAGGSFEENKGKVDAAIERGQKLAFTDDQVRDSFQQLLAATGDVNEALDRQKLAMDLSRGAGISLETASRMVGKVTDENVQAFKRMGITIKDGATEAEALAAVQAKFSGQSEAYAKSTAGQFQQAKIALSEVKESIGYALLPVFTTLAGALARALPVLQEWVGSWSGVVGDAVSGALEAIGRTIVDIAIALFPVVEKMAELAGMALGAGWDALMAAAGWLGEILVPALSDAAGWAMNLAGMALGAGWDALMAAAGWLAEILVPALSDAAGAAGDLVLAFGGFAWEQIQAAGEFIRDTLYPAVQDVATAFLDWGTVKFDELTGQLQGVGDAVAGIDMDTLATGWEKFTDAIQPSIDFLTPFAERLLPAWEDALNRVAEALSGLGEALAPLEPLVRPIAIVIGGILTAAIAGLIIQLEVSARAIGLLATALITVLTVAVQAIMGTINGLIAVFGAVATAVGETQDAITTAWGEIQSGTETTWGAIQGTVETVTGAIQETIETVLGAISGTWDTVWGAMSATLSTIWTGMSSAVQTAWDTLSGIVTLGLDSLSNAWDTVWGNVSTALSTAWDGILSTVGLQLAKLGMALANFAIEALGFGADIGDAVMSGLMAAAQNMLSTVINFFKSLASSIWDAMTSVIGLSPSPLGMAIATGLVQGVALGATSALGILADFGVSAAAIGTATGMAISQGLAGSGTGGGGAPGMTGGEPGHWGQGGIGGENPQWFDTLLTTYKGQLGFSIMSHISALTTAQLSTLRGINLGSFRDQWEAYQRSQGSGWPGGIFHDYQPPTGYLPWGGGNPGPTEGAPMQALLSGQSGGTTIAGTGSMIVAPKPGSGGAQLINVDVTFDFSGAQLTGTVAENEAMMRKVVKDELSDQFGRGATLYGTPNWQVSNG